MIGGDRAIVLAARPYIDAVAVSVACLSHPVVAVPTPIVEIPVVIRDLVAVDPIDRRAAITRHIGVGASADGAGPTDHSVVRGVFPDEAGQMHTTSLPLHDAVVVTDISFQGVTGGIGHEQEAEFVLGSQAVGNQRPVGGHQVDLLLGQGRTGQQEAQDDQQPRGQRGEAAPEAHDAPAPKHVPDSGSRRGAPGAGNVFAGGGGGGRSCRSRPPERTHLGRENRAFCASSP